MTLATCLDGTTPDTILLKGGMWIVCMHSSIVHTLGPDQKIWDLKKIGSQTQRILSCFKPLALYLNYAN